MWKKRKNEEPGEPVFDSVKTGKHRKLRIVLLFSAALLFVTFLFSFLYLETAIIPEAKKTVAKISLEPDDDHMVTTLYYYNKEIEDWDPMEMLFSENNRRWVAYKFIPVGIRNAAVAIEDKRFWSHSGVDWFRTASAFAATGIRKVFGVGTVQGGSTITQQLIKNLTGNTQVTLKRKLCEIVEARMLERQYSKEEILEAYLNKIYFGHNAYGIYRASWKYFGKDPEKLSAAESAMLVALTNNPAYYDPYKFPEHLCQRAFRVLSAMKAQDYLSEKEWKQGIADIGFSKDGSFDMSRCSVSFHDESIGSKLADADQVMDGTYSWYTDAVIEALIKEFTAEGRTREAAVDLIYNGGLSVYTMYDADVQKAVDAVYEKPLKHKSKSGQALESGITVIDNETGAIVATAGGFGVKDDSRLWSHATQEIRSPASAIKPLSVYAPAMEMDYCYPEDTVYDQPFMKVDGKDWPRNDSGKYTGTMTVTKAVADSVNTVAVDLLDQIGIDTSYDWLEHRFHLSHLNVKDKAYAPLALGGMTDGVTVEEMASAYAVFARDGVYMPGYYYTTVEDSEGNQLIFHGDEEDEETVCSEETAEEITEVLQAVVDMGTGTDARLSGFAAGKTGTTNNRKDLWFCGYTDRYTAAVWAGYDKPETIRYDKENISAVLWRDVMKKLN